MAITKSTFGSTSKLDADYDVSSQEDDEDLQSLRADSESDNNTEQSETDSGMGSDDYDISELGEVGSEYCQEGDQSFLLPVELYDLPDLTEILSVDTWNNCLTEEERFSLSAYLPDMDQETYSQTMRELLSGSNFHFGSPMSDIFNRLRGGLSEPKVDLHRRCMNYFQRNLHYHRLRNYQNSMVESLVRMRNAWENYAGYGVEEKIQLLNILQSQRSLKHSNHLRSKKMSPASTVAPLRKNASKKIIMSKEEDIQMEVQRSKKGARRPIYEESVEPRAGPLTIDHRWEVKTKIRKGDGGTKSKSRRILLPHFDQQGSESSGQREEEVFTKKKKNLKHPDGILGNGESKLMQIRIKKKPKKEMKLETVPSPLHQSKSIVDQRPSRKLTKSWKLQGNHGPDVEHLDLEEKVISSPRDLRLEDGFLNQSMRSTDQNFGVDFAKRSHLNVSGSDSVVKKRRSKTAPAYRDDLSDVDESGPKKKKKGKRRSISGSLSHSLASPNEPKVEVEREDFLSQAELDPSPSKKPFTLITPSVHTCFSFSVVHLLSAVRKAMVNTAAIDDIMEENQDHRSLPSLTLQEIVTRVRTNPGDPCILETQEPLQDLIRGVLKILSSKTAPLGAKSWKPLVLYEKVTKTWSWVGSGLTSEEETSAEAWGIPHKTLVKLVDSFANWLKSGQETLKQIGSLPAPPIFRPPVLDEKERFKDLRAQKSLVTITPSSEEARAYFRCEELLRYSVPDRAFSYTAADGKKSTVAPLRRGGGKPTSKARDHFMLKQDRPPHVTILCLVRDAAARLPASIGTRADVSTLMRDSQYLVEDVPDSKVNSVVSGALDRLHYEQDPCVQYDGERKLWVYLHRDREEEDFEDDGTASKKKWKRPRRGAAAGDDSTAAGLEAEEEEEEEEGVAALIDSMERGGAAGQGHPMGWEVLGIGAVTAAEERMVCRENSTNEDFDDDGFGRERLVSTSLF